MTAKEVILKAVDELPEECLDDLAVYAEQLRRTALLHAVPTALASEAECSRALTDFATYHLSHGLGLLDALIAACAIGRSATLCTFNVKHYAAVPGLITAQPYAR